MSFALDLKTELCEEELVGGAEERAFAYGLALFARRFSAEDISFSIAHRRTAELFCEVMRRFAGVDVVVREAERSGMQLYCVSVPDGGDRVKLMEAFYHEAGEPHLRINRSNFEDDDCIPYFLRGAFLVCGALSDPARGYHLEFDAGTLNLSRDLSALIGENLVQPKITVRRGSHIVYYKESENIEDILTYMGATKSTVEMMNAKILKDVRNRVNRRTNCETANIDKTVAASAEQVEDIELIYKQRGREYLSDDLRTLADLRLENPELSLRELGEMLEPNLTRSGVNHRMSKLSQMAEDLRDSERVK